MIKIVSIVGARPQFIKAVVISRAIVRHNRNTGGDGPKIEEIIIHTGQHYDEEMSKVFFDKLSIPEPRYNLGIGSSNHGCQTGQMLIKIEEVLLKERPDYLLVYGDTNSTLAGALASAKLHIPIGHVEAGLRSFNKKMPEEINRILTDHLSTLLFCPTKTAVKNLCEEGITEGAHNVGDVMYESLLHNAEIAEKESDIIASLNLTPRGYCLATIHRPANTDNEDNLKLIIASLEEVGLPVILPVHPRTEKALSSLNHRPVVSNIRLIRALSYFDMLILEKNAAKILTDSGGVQKEAYFFKVPCITLREETEWIETLENGWNILVGARKEEIIEAANNVEPEETQHKHFGDGNTGRKIVKMLMNQVI